MGNHNGHGSQKTGKGDLRNFHERKMIFLTDKV